MSDTDSLAEGVQELLDEEDLPKDKMVRRRIKVPARWWLKIGNEAEAASITREEYLQMMVQIARKEYREGEIAELREMLENGKKTILYYREKMVAAGIDVAKFIDEPLSEAKKDEAVSAGQA